MSQENTPETLENSAAEAETAAEAPVENQSENAIEAETAAEAPVENQSENAIEAQENESNSEAEQGNTKRASLILGTAIILAVAALLILYIMPPLSWTPEKEVQSNFQAVSTVVSVDAGSAARYELTYAPIRERTVYTLEIEQKSRYAEGETKATIRADVEMNLPARHDTEDTVSITLSNVEAHAYDGEEEVKLASAGAMLAGISLYARLEKRNGLGTVVPDANINPQVARVLYMVTDALRQAWPVLPEEAMGAGGSWQLEDRAIQESKVIKKTEIKLVDMQEKSMTLEAKSVLNSTEKTSSLGTGTAKIHLQNGKVEDAVIAFERHETLIDGGASEQQVHAELRHKE